MTTMYSLMILIVYLLTVTAAFEEKDDNILEKIDNLREDLSTFSGTISDMEEDMSRRIEYECKSGLHSDLCSNESNKDEKRSISWSDPQTQSAEYTSWDSPLRKLVDYLQKREALRHLRRVLNGADLVLRQERKRSCNLNLGFHCSSGDILKMAHDYNWVKSDYSPGKKKRSV